MENKINKYRLKTDYISSLDRFIGRLTNEQKQIIENGDNSDRKKD